MESPNRVLCRGKLSNKGVPKKTKKDPKLNIYLDTLYYFPGNVITGMLVWDNHGDHEIKKVKLKFNAHEHVEWTEGSGEHSVTYVGHSNIIKYKTYLMGNADTKMKVTRQIYQLPINLQLPLDYCPQSVKCMDGRIVYKISAEVQYTGIKFNKHTSGYIVVYKPVPPSIELKEISEYKHAEKKNITHIVTATGKAFCQGETLSLKLYIDNLSTHKISGIYAKIKQNIEYIASGKTKNSVTCISKYKVNKDNIPKTPHSHWDCPELIQLQIPSDGLATIDASEAKKLHIYHNVSVTIKYDFMKGNAKIKFPIHIYKWLA